jgi:hypothetical protein
MASRNYTAAYAALVSSNVLRPKCEMFLLIDAAQAIVNEDPATPDHEARVAWAKAVETDDGARSRSGLRLAIKCVQNPAILAAIAAGSEVDDGDIQFVGLGAISDLVAMGAN